MHIICKCQMATTKVRNYLVHEAFRYDQNSTISSENEYSQKDDIDDTTSCKVVYAVSGIQ